jgi:hypothetical protein
MNRDRNYLGLFTEEELSAALALIGSRENARAVAAEVYSIPEAEQIHYDWIDTPVYLLACVSEALEERVTRDFFDPGDADHRDSFRDGLNHMRRLVRHHASDPSSPVPFAVEGVIYDTRQPEGRPEDLPASSTP